MHVTNATEDAVRAAFDQANSSDHTIIEFDVAGPIFMTRPIVVTGNYVTVLGNGVTLAGANGGWTIVGPMLQFAGHDVIVHNMRLRNGGDNLRAQPLHTKPDGNYNVVFDHISSTASYDDGISIGYGAHDVTVQYCFLAGNTRSLFLKYGNTRNISIHHTWVMKQWIRGPLASSSTFVDFRNNIISDWQLWGVRYEDRASGNVINSIFEEGAYAQSTFGNGQDGLIDISDQPVYVSGVEFRDHARAQYTATSDTALPAPHVTTQSVAAMEPNVRSNAGSMPRDAVDQAYINMGPGWRKGERDPIRRQP